MTASLSREEIAKREIGKTDIAPWLARAMTVAFLAVTFAVPLLHEFTATEKVPQEQTRRTWPYCCAIFTSLPEVAQVFDHSDGDLWQRTLAANRRLLQNIDLYESSLKDEAQLVERLLGPTQYCLARWGGLGNEKAYLGRDGWLFYRPSVDYLTGPGFLEPRVLAKRAQAGKPYAAPPHPDPRPAILEFAEELRHRGIALIIVPAPSKAMVHPEQLSPRYSAADDPLQNGSFTRFKQDMEDAGVIVFEPSELLRSAWKQTGEPQYLKTDTHWTCRAVQRIAGSLGDLIDQRSLLPPAGASDYESRIATVTNLGDIAAMLRLPDEQALFPAESVEVRTIADENGTDWQPDPASDILLLGDSFTNIYSQDSMNWGSAAGLAEQLSYVVRRPIDRISQNDSGAFATRQTLAQELARGNDRLAGKRLVIWEFAARELALGDWKLIPLPDPPAPKASRPVAPPTDEAPIIVRATIEATAGVPRPGSVPYRDAITALHLSGIEAIRGAAPGGQIVVYVLGMQNNHWTAAARYKPGSTVTLRLQPWENVASKYGSLTRIDLDDPDFTLVDLPLFWGEENP
jgi:hypothetical protein